MFFFFKQKTAYEMRISDWSSDVCSSDLLPFDQVDAGDLLGHRMLDLQPRVHLHEPDAVGAQTFGGIGDELDRPGADIIDRLRRAHRGGAELLPRRFVPSGGGEIGRASCRERVCQYV